MAARACTMINATQKIYKSSQLTTNQKINDLLGTHIHNATRAHIQYVMLIMAIESLQSHKFADKKIAPMLTLCIKIFALKMLGDSTQGLYECGYF